MADLTLSLTKRFALFAGLVVVAASLLLISMYRQVAGDDLTAMAERSNVSLAQMFSNVVWDAHRSEEHTSELQSLMRISYAVFCLKKKTNTQPQTNHNHISSTIYKTPYQ